MYTPDYIKPQCLCTVTVPLYAHNYNYAGRDTYQEGLACYRLGNAYEGIGEHDTAIQVCYCIYQGLISPCVYMTACIPVHPPFPSITNVTWSVASTTMMMKVLAMLTRHYQDLLRGV